MKPLRVLYSAVYLSADRAEFQRFDKGANYSANKFVKAIKGTPKWRFDGSATVPIPGRTPITFSWLTRERAAPAFAARMWPRLKMETIGRIGLVPIPSSNSTVAKPIADCGPSRLAHALADASEGEAVVCDVFRWNEDHGSVSAGAAQRDPGELYANLVLTGSLDTKLEYVLVDDNFTSGAHLQACAAKLSIDADIEIAFLATAGRTFHEAHEDPFAGGEWELPGFLP